jgi:hypothetical protein
MNHPAYKYRVEFYTRLALSGGLGDTETVALDLQTTVTAWLRANTTGDYCIALDLGADWQSVTTSILFAEAHDALMFKLWREGGAA